MKFFHILSTLLTLLSFHAVSSLCDKRHSYTIRFERHPFSPNRLEYFKGLAENSIILHGGRIDDRFEDGFRCTATQKVVTNLIRYLTAHLPPYVFPRYGLPTVTRDPDQSAMRSNILQRQMRPHHPMRDEQEPSQQTMQQGSMSSTAPTTLGILPRFYAQQSTVLVMKPKVFGFSGNDWVTIKDLNGDPAFKVRAEALSLSHLVHVSDPEAQHLFTIQREPSFGTFKAYAKDLQGNRLFDFNEVRSFRSMKNKITFINAADGRNVQLLMEMGMLEKTFDI